MSNRTARTLRAASRTLASLANRLPQGNRIGKAKAGSRRRRAPPTTKGGHIFRYNNKIFSWLSQIPRAPISIDKRTRYCTQKPLTESIHQGLANSNPSDSTDGSCCHYTDAVCLSINSCSFAFGCTPVTCSTTSPPLNSSKAGIPVTPYFIARS